MSSNQPSTQNSEKQGSVNEKESATNTYHVEADSAAAALAAATVTVKPELFSPGMVKLWTIVNIA